MTDLTFAHHHGAISVRDLDETLDWYKRVLNFDIEKRFHIAAIPADTAMLRNGDLRIEVFCVPGAAPLPEGRDFPDRDNRTLGNKHISFVIPGPVEDFGAELAKRGADIIWIKRMPHGANIFIRDNTGNVIEFVEEPMPTGRISTL